MEKPGCLPLASLVAVLLTLLLAPGLRADEKADALLKQVAEKTRATKALSADLEMTAVLPDQTQPLRGTGAVTLMRPNFARITVGGPFAQTIASDGKTIYLLDAQKQYQKRSVSAQGTELNLLWAMPIAYFFNPGLAALAPFGGGSDVKTRWAGTETVGGKTFQAVAVTGAKPIQHTITLFIGPDSLFHRVRVELKNEGKTARYEANLTNLQTTPTMTPASFAYKPPADAKEFVVPERPALLADGSTAPDFTVADKNGKPVKLSDFRGKVVVLDFWATWCGPCMSSFPHTVEVARKFQNKNVVVLAVNVWDKKDAFDAWLPKHADWAGPLTFAIDTQTDGKDVATALYKVSGIPTQYVINGEGKIVRSFVGFSGPTGDLEEAIKAAGGS